MNSVASITPNAASLTHQTAKTTVNLVKRHLQLSLSFAYSAARPQRLESACYQHGHSSVRWDELARKFQVVDMEVAFRRHC